MSQLRMLIHMACHPCVGDDSKLPGVARKAQTELEELEGKLKEARLEFQEELSARAERDRRDADGERCFRVEMKPPDACEKQIPGQGTFCVKKRGHDGIHMFTVFAGYVDEGAPPRCRARESPPIGEKCERPEGHEGQHEITRPPIGPDYRARIVRWT